MNVATSWPHFLDLLDTDPDLAFREFYVLAIQIMATAPPRPMRGLTDEDFKDVEHDIILHCVDDNFSVLRKYVDTGKSFAAWFYTIAHNRCLDWLRGKKVQDAVVPLHGNGDKRGVENFLPDLHANGNKEVEYKDILDIVNRIKERIGKYCRMLLEMAADEMTPREMVLVLRLSPDQNKKVSDDLRYCRKKLKALLEGQGIDIRAFL